MDVRFVGVTLNEAVALLEEDEDLDPAEVYIEPPEAAVISDEDSGDEDEAGTLNNSNGRQLQAPCEVVLSKSSKVPVDSETDRNSSSHKADEHGNGDYTPPLPKKAKKSARVKAIWVKKDIKPKATTFPEPDYSKYRDKSPVELFEMFLDESIVKFLVDQSNNYALFLNESDPKITVEKLEVFIGICILSGYNTVPGKRFYWDQMEDTRNNLVYKAMRCDRFLTIMRYFHCADNTKPNLRDKMWKLRPLMTMLQANLLKHFVPLKKLNFDESMIAYDGKHGWKQFIRGKPIRFGYKVWCLNSPNGYLVNFEVYQGKSYRGNEQYDVDFGKAAAPLVVMIDNLPEGVRALPFEFYINSLFTGIRLMSHLKKLGYQCTGTIRNNRLPADIPLTENTAMKKLDRGSHEVVQNEENIAVVRWVDNSVVTAASTCFGVEPLRKVGRYCREKKKRIQVPFPAIFSEYNSGMGGTDLMDENINRFRIGIRGKKWWWPIVTYLIDMCVNNAWILSKGAGNHMTQLQFKRTIVQTYLGSYQNIPKSGGCPRGAGSLTGMSVPDYIRYDGFNHFLKPTENGSKRRCALENCPSRARSECSKCDVGLCLTCNIDFHVKKT